MKEVTKFQYKLMVWGFIAVGLIGNAILSTMGIMNGWTYYIATYSGMFLGIAGVGIGLAIAHSFSIKHKTIKSNGGETWTEKTQ